MFYTCGRLIEVHSLYVLKSECNQCPPSILVHSFKHCIKSGMTLCSISSGLLWVLQWYRVEYHTHCHKK